MYDFLLLIPALQTNGQADSNQKVKLVLNQVEAEWFYNVETRRLHVRTRGDQHPCFLHVQARVQTYALRISNSTNLILDHLHFFATTVWAGALSPGKGGDETMGDVQGIVFQGLSFEYPHAQQVSTRTDSLPSTLTLQTPFHPPVVSFRQIYLLRPDT